MKRYNNKNKIVIIILGLIWLQVSFAAQAFANWNDWKSSYATYTYTGYTNGAACLDPIPPTMEITALDPADYNAYGVKAALAGAYLEVKGPKGKTVVYVNDLYTGGGVGALDLCPASFAKIGDMSAGKTNIQWRVIKAPIKGNLLYKIAEGSSQWWAGVQIRNHKYPVIKMEYNKNGKWINMEKKTWNQFVGNNVGAGSLKIRITDIRGKVVMDTLPAFPDNGTTPARIILGKVQLPD